jgi:hypothetical protein
MGWSLFLTSGWAACSSLQHLLPGGVEWIILIIHCQRQSIVNQGSGPVALSELLKLSLTHNLRTFLKRWKDQPCLDLRWESSFLLSHPESCWNPATIPNSFSSLKLQVCDTSEIPGFPFHVFHWHWHLTTSGHIVSHQTAHQSSSWSFSLNQSFSNLQIEFL